MTTFLGFFINRQTRDEFVAPTNADDITTARGQLIAAYPESRYNLLTIYSREERNYVLKGIERWPGLPSKVQPPVTADLSKVTASTSGLPPLPGQVQAKVQPVQEATPQQIPAWMQSIATMQATAQAQAKPQAPAKAAQPLMQAMAQTRAATPQPVAQQSLIERLKASRGESMGSAIRREPKQPEISPATITRNPSGASVIDILKSMRK